MRLLGGGTRTARRAAGSALLSMSLIACATGSGHAEPDGRRTDIQEARTIRSGGIDRAYGMFVPAGASQHPALVVLVHLYLFGAPAAGAGNGLPMLHAARRNGFAIAAPTGAEFSFNGGTCCGAAVRRGLDDVGFLDDVIADATRRYGIDPHRVYLVGFSNGGFLAYRYACERPGKIAGAAIVEGALLVPCAPHRPIDLLVLHQTGDETVPLAGTERSTIPGDPVPLPSVASGVSEYLRGARCPTHGHRTVRRGRARTVVRCRGRRVETLVARGGAHRWPTATDGIDGARAVTSFFGLDQR